MYTVRYKLKGQSYYTEECFNSEEDANRRKREIILTKKYSEVVVFFGQEEVSKTNCL